MAQRLRRMVGANLKQILNQIEILNSYYPGCITYTVYRQPLQHLKEDYEVIPILRSLLTDNPPSPGKVGHTTGVYVPSLLPFFLFEQKYKNGLDEQDLTPATPIEKGTKLDYKPLLRKMSPHLSFWVRGGSKTGLRRPKRKGAQKRTPAARTIIHGPQTRGVSVSKSSKVAPGTSATEKTFLSPHN